MESVDSDSFRRILEGAGLKAADPAGNIGRCLSFIRSPARTIVVQLGDAADRRSRLTSAVLSIADRWLLTPRYGSVAALDLLSDKAASTAAISFASSERAGLGSYLCERPMDLWEASADLYFLTPSGDVLVTWDHHTADECLTVQLCKVDDSNRLLVALNEIGADLEVSYESG